MSEQALPAGEPAFPSSVEIVATLVRKELAQALRNRMTLMTLAISTIAFTLLPLIIAYGLGSAGPLQNINKRAIDPQQLELIGRAFPQLAGLAPSDQVQALLLSGMQSLFLLIPLMIPMIIAVYSVIGEKQNRSLEALLATPITTAELLAGKCLAAALPGIASGWLSYTLFAILAWPATQGPVFDSVLVRPGWLLALLLLTPGAAFLAVTLGLIVSSRATDPQAAQQIAGVVVLPVVGLMIGQMVGVVQLGTAVVLIAAAVLFAIDAALLAVAVRLFQRETILTRWK
ncbi:MAG TPA: ABC transporter permease subunit [Chloroflexia bacterium]|nr:ABC transporter permease subunit [Chloroflexia bacterium]